MLVKALGAIVDDAGPMIASTSLVEEGLHGVGAGFGRVALFGPFDGYVVDRTGRRRH